MKKLKILVGAVALFAFVVVNVWNAGTSLKSSELALANVEAMANPEGLDDVQGRKDEFERYQCPVTKTVTFNAYGRYQLPDGSYIEGRANSTETRSYTYTARNCQRGEGNCTKIRCR